MYQLFQRDAVSLLRSLPNESIDLICTDPPYSSLEKHRAVGTTTRLKGDWFPVVPNEYFDEWFKEAARVLAKNSHLYFFCDQETMFDIVPRVARIGALNFHKAIIWDKVKIGMGYHYRAKHEMILFFEKGKRKLNNLGVADVLHVPRVRGSYPTEKPVGILRTLIDNSTDVGDIVLDPFMGSGATGVAALQIGRAFVGGDVLDASMKLAGERLEATVAETLVGAHFN